MSALFYKRLLEISLPHKQSAFFWGARKTGKSTFLKAHFPQSVYYDFLKTEIFYRFAKEPHLFREEILALPQESLLHPIIVDEIQKIPMLLNEIHWLIENLAANFILCGSSARKLRQGGVNLLGGRAWGYYFYPLVTKEIPEYSLLKIFNHGAIPSHYNSENINKSLTSYVEDYLTHEIQAEGLVRNLPSFARFLESIGFNHGEMINYSNIARDCGVDAKTVKEYYQILVDTLLGYFLLPYNKKNKREIILSTPKFYLFDVGIANFLAKKVIVELKGSDAGKSLEHFVLQELIAYRGLNDLRYSITYWRTKSGLEVDFVIDNAKIAIEVKISNCLRKADLHGLLAFAQEYNCKKLLVVSNDLNARKLIDGECEILILSYRDFLAKLWNKQIIEI